MHPMKFDVMDRKKKILYESMWGSEKFKYSVKNTPYKVGASKNSYMFSGTSDAPCDVLIQAFSIAQADEELFRKKFSDACSGDGKEENRIATLHSSSLCALLFFYRVSQDPPYTLEIGEETYCFTDSYFEYQNPVLGRASNIDVVLVGTKDEQPVVLFLESKFSEYYLYAGRKSDEISAKYRENKVSGEIYRPETLAGMGLELQPAENDEFILCSEQPCYLDGIKQMISHYMGVRNRCEMVEKYGVQEEDAVAEAILNGAKVLLGEILFELPFESGKASFGNYQTKYESLANVLNEQLERDGKREKIEVLPRLLTYSQLRDCEHVPDEVKAFYFGMRK